MNGCETQLISANLEEAMRFFGRARQHGGVQDEPGVCLIHCGLGYAAFNAAVITQPVGGDADELCRRILLSGRYFGSLNLPWTCWLCDDFVDDRLRRQSPKLFKRYGLAPLTSARGMYLDRLAPPERALPPLCLRRVEDQDTRLAFARITSVAFETPAVVCQEIYGAERAWKSSFQGYVGYWNGAPVCSAAVAVSSGAVGVYSVATLPKFRRKGCAEAILRLVLADARTRTGIETSVLQSTESGLRLYQRLGYRLVTNFSVYIS